MKKEIVVRSEIKLVGLTVRTNNKNEMNPETGKIAALASRFWSDNMASQIPHRKNPGMTFAVYTDYESNEHGDYAYFIGEEVTSFDGVSSSLGALTIPSAKYQKFTTSSGKMPDVVISAWQKIWRMSAPDFEGERSYIADFEVYDHRAVDPLNTSLDIYIGIKGR